MKKYGICIYTKDHTPGNKSSDTDEEWYETEDERNQAYNDYIAYQNRPTHPRDVEIEYEMSLYGTETTRTYRKIEKE